MSVYLLGTTYLRMPLFGIIPVVTLFVVCAGAQHSTLKPFQQPLNGIITAGSMARPTADGRPRPL